MNTHTQTMASPQLSQSFQSSHGVFHNNQEHSISDIGNLFSTQQMMIMMLPTLIHTITGILTAIITVAFSSSGFGIIMNFIMSFNKTPDIKPAEFVVTQSTRIINTTSAHMSTDGDHSYNCNLIFAILDTLTKLKLPIISADVNLQVGSKNNYDDDDKISKREQMMASTTHFIPRDGYIYNGMLITYKKSEISNTNTDKDSKDVKSNVSGITYVLSITSYTKTFHEIEKFAMQCYRDWVDVEYPISTAVKPRKLFYQIKSTKAYPMFKQYNYGVCNPEKAFDGIFVPEHYLRKLHTLLRKVTSGKINKLIVLFTGRPGCGKTTLQRAILEFLNRHCIVQKLAHTGNDEELMDTYFSETISTPTGCIDVPLNERVYLLEDVDAESKLLHCRKQKNKAILLDEKSENANPMPVNKSISPIMSAFIERPTMSGYLNAIDGIMRLKKAVILMSSNHPESHYI